MTIGDCYRGLLKRYLYEDVLSETITTLVAIVQYKRELVNLSSKLTQLTLLPYLLVQKEKNDNEDEDEDVEKSANIASWSKERPEQSQSCSANSGLNREVKVMI